MSAGSKLVPGGVLDRGSWKADPDEDDGSTDNDDDDDDNDDDDDDDDDDNDDDDDDDDGSDGNDGGSDDGTDSDVVDGVAAVTKGSRSATRKDHAGFTTPVRPGWMYSPPVASTTWLLTSVPPSASVVTTTSLSRGWSTATTRGACCTHVTRPVSTAASTRHCVYVVESMTASLAKKMPPTKSSPTPYTPATRWRSHSSMPGQFKCVSSRYSSSSSAACRAPRRASGGDADDHTRVPQGARKRYRHLECAKTALDGQFHMGIVPAQTGSERKRHMCELRHCTAVGKFSDDSGERAA